jgi:hypothetical protein
MRSEGGEPNIGYLIYPMNTSTSFLVSVPSLGTARSSSRAQVPARKSYECKGLVVRLRRLHRTVLREPPDPGSPY